MYRYKEKSFEKVIIFNEVNYKSYAGAQTFSELMYSFSNISVDYRTHLIIDIKSIKFKKNKATEIHDYAWTVFPLFSTLESNDSKNSLEMYFRSGSYMMPLFEGSLREDVANELVNQDDIWIYLINENKKKVSPVAFLGNSAVVVKCIDHQREKHFKKFVDWNRFDYGF